ncbi:uncharacterized protein LAESUDRAFT_761600 [Laetiporus sulphureus 93-53]|uniref:Uncharacterized protein n=1 Tax=Laetiporus sulphureus 93-53 TaxID=1314785 RepID=A0A165CYC8_9APHY|nr:uncharacterized protein LAESUDRAFT_761600 [Laetiporus sulphureus 93-53]KZT03740.1 hypothetical protein LAESUDRAFT_761600 [Laetiporus sulphureus 93-53]
MPSSTAIALTLAVAAVPSVAFPIDDIAVLSRALQYRRTINEVDSIFARSSYDDHNSPQSHFGLDRLADAQPGSRGKRFPSPFVILPSMQSKVNIPACHLEPGACRRSFLDELD